MAFLRGACLLVVVTLASAAPAAAGQVAVGDDLPEITLEDWGGSERSVPEDAPPLVIIEFWASWCTACRTTLPAVAAVAAEYAEAVHLFAINVDRDRGKADRFLREYLPERPPSVTILSDPGGAVLSRFGAAGMPAVYASENGVVRFVETGASADLVERLRIRAKKVANGHR